MGSHQQDSRWAGQQKLKAGPNANFMGLGRDRLVIVKNFGVIMGNRQQVRWEGCPKFWRPALFWVCTWGNSFFILFPKSYLSPPIWKENVKKKILLAFFLQFALDRSYLQYLFWAIYRYFDWCWWLGWGWGLSFTTTRLQNNPWCRGEDKEMWPHPCRWPAVPWLSLVDVGISWVAKFILSCKEITIGWILYLFSLATLPPK